MNDHEMNEQAALTLEVHSDGVAWLVFDQPDSRVNLLSTGIMRRLDHLIGQIEGRAGGDIRAVVVRSGKPATFVAGADIGEIAGITDPERGTAASRDGQRIFRRLEELPVPTVAAVDGICLGGGTELTLACHRRLASTREETRIGLPEIRLGIIPGFGGTTRLPRLIGLEEALGLILTGRTVDAKQAQRLGLVDEAVPTEVLYDRALELALETAAGRRPDRRRPRLTNLLLERTAPGRALLLSQARKRVLKETQGRYPAPLVALETIEQSLGVSLDEAFELEARALGQLIVTDVSKNLIHVFHLMEAAKKAAPSGARVRPVERSAVVGAGVMGGGIAQLLASRDIAVRLKDIRTDAIAHGLAHARKLFDRAVEKRRIERRDAARHMNHIAPTLDYTGFGTVQLVVEAVVERMDVKKGVLREIEARVPDDCVITSNTSSLSISAMQTALDRPANFCGMHFFNPVERMPLVEVIRGEVTSDDAVATVFALARQLDKTPVIVNDGPGFLVNRILAPYLNEAAFLLGEGAGIEEIDAVLLDFGMPMGPLRLLDEVGLDVARHAAGIMHEAFGARMRPAQPLAALEATGLTGKKGGRGFYVYADDEQKSVNDAIYAALGGSVTAKRTELPGDRIRDRCVLAMVNEAARVLEDGIVGRPGDVDLGMITGIGFPPFRGGLLRWADALGVRTVLGRLEELERTVGERFAPAPGIRDLASNGRGFYD
ncbi:MAG: 3-hydroxyacyl-CoA dehydrogenase NAD-binding domain-containing protein [Longimicrobiales bacterium]